MIFASVKRALIAFFHFLLLKTLVEGLSETTSLPEIGLRFAYALPSPDLTLWDYIGYVVVVLFGKLKGQCDKRKEFARSVDFFS